MKKYIVTVKEVHNQDVEIRAKNEQEAIKKVSEGEGEELTLEYSHTLDTDTWTVKRSNLKEYKRR